MAQSLEQIIESRRRTIHVISEEVADLEGRVKAAQAKGLHAGVTALKSVIKVKKERLARVVVELGGLVELQEAGQAELPGTRSTEPPQPGPVAGRAAQKPTK